MKQNNIRAILTKHSIVPVVTFNALEEVDPLMQRLKAQEISCIEITLRTSIAFEAIALAKRNYGHIMDIGVGTLITKDQIERAAQLEVDFMVSPGLNVNLAATFEASGIPFIPGVATPSDIITGIQLGWDTFKFFPAHIFGGLDALKTYSQVFPEVRFCPTGGIKAETYSHYLNLPNVISVGGSWMQ